MVSLVTWSVLLIVAAVGVVVSANSLRLRHGVAADVTGLWSSSNGSLRIDRGRLDGFPEPVRRYLVKAIGSREFAVRSARLRHGGVFRTKLDGPWLRIRGEQYFNAAPPGFLWWGRIRIAPGIWVDARDRSVSGVGNMRIWLQSTVTLTDSAGAEIDQGAMLRLLAEMVWFPTALQDDRYVNWVAVDGTRAKATLRIGGRDVSAAFEFGEDGLPTRISAERYRDVGGGKAVLTPWSGECRAYRDVQGLLVPHELESYWLVDGRRTPVLRFEVDRLEYDVPSTF